MRWDLGTHPRRCRVGPWAREADSFFIDRGGSDAVSDDGVVGGAGLFDVVGTGCVGSSHCGAPFRGAHCYLRGRDSSGTDLIRKYRRKAN